MATNQAGEAPSPSSDDLAPPCLATLTRLIEVDPYSLPADEQVRLIVEWERHTSWLESLKADALAAVAGPGISSPTSPHDDLSGFDPNASHTSARERYHVEDSICDEVASALRVAGQTARRRIAVARDLTYKLPETRRLLRDGKCSYAQAAVVSTECEFVEPAKAKLVEARALGRTDKQTPAQTRRSVRRAIAAICPMDPAEQIEAEFARRDVRIIPEGSVMATIIATLPAPDAMLVWNALTGCAARGDEAHPNPHSDDPNQLPDNRTMAHKRADALTAWANRAMEDPTFPTMQGKKRLETQVVIPLDTLTGLNDESAEIVGYGPIPPILARRLAAESDQWRRLVTDPVTGHLLDYGHKTYSPPAALREFILARDRTCQFPGCNMAGWRCDIDHIDPWIPNNDPESDNDSKSAADSKSASDSTFDTTNTQSPGGKTSADNLITLCRRHHRLKTHNHWTVTVESSTTNEASATNDPVSEEQAKPGEQDEQGTIITWISPRKQVNQRRRTRIPEPDSTVGRIELALMELLLE